MSINYHFSGSFLSHNFHSPITIQLLCLPTQFSWKNSTRNRLRSLPADSRKRKTFLHYNHHSQQSQPLNTCVCDSHGYLFIIPGELILLPKAARSYDQDFKTNENRWVPLHKQSSQRVTQSYASTIETDKNWGWHLLKPSYRRAGHSYARMWDRQGTCHSRKKPQEADFSGPFFQWDPNSEQPTKCVQQGSPGRTIAPRVQYQERMWFNGQNHHMPRRSLIWERWSL